MDFPGQNQEQINQYQYFVWQNPLQMVRFWILYHCIVLKFNWIDFLSPFSHSNSISPIIYSFFLQVGHQLCLNLVWKILYINFLTSIWGQCRKKHPDGKVHIKYLTLLNLILILNFFSRSQLTHLYARADASLRFNQFYEMNRNQKLLWRFYDMAYKNATYDSQSF